MGRSVNMHEGLVLVSILVATILSGILGALLVVPVLASSVVVVNYLLKRVSGQRPFQTRSNLVRIGTSTSKGKTTLKFRLPKKFKRK